MHCVIYKSRRKDGLYLFVAATGPDDAEGRLEDVPPALLEHLGEREFVMQLNLSPERTLAQADPDEVRNSLADKRYYLQMPPPTSKLHLTPRAERAAQ